MPDENAKRIMVVDDEPLICRGVAHMLMREGYQCLTACDGEKALELIAREKPALVLLDVEMPKLDGFAVARKIKLDPQTANTSVIFLTGRRTLADVRKAREVNAVGYIIKPFDLKDVARRIQEFFTKHDQGTQQAPPA